jgi:hypothetical protein
MNALVGEMRKNEKTSVWFSSKNFRGSAFTKLNVILRWQEKHA